MPAVRARLDDHVGGGADVAAVLGRGAAGFHRHLGERRGRQEDAAAAELGERRVDAVDVDALVGEVSPVDRRPRLLDVVVLRVGGDAGQGVDDPVVGARGTRGLFADLGRDGAAGGDVELVDHGRFGRDVHDATLDGRLQGEVDGLAVAGGGVEGRLGGAQALQFRLQVICVGHDADETVLAVLVRDRELVAAAAGQGDAHAGQGRTPRVDDRAAYRCCLRCVGEGTDRDQHHQDQCESLHELLLGSGCGKGVMPGPLYARPGASQRRRDGSRMLDCRRRTLIAAKRKGERAEALSPRFP